MPNRPDTNDEMMLQRWRDSRGHSDAVDMWKTAKGVRIGEYAFTAIASDNTVLNRLPAETAIRLVRDAQNYVGTLRTIVGQRRPDESPASAAMHAVMRAMSNWHLRQAGARAVPDEGLAATTLSVQEAVDAARAEEWKEALKRYPQFDETTGAMTLAAVVALGGNGLVKVQEPWDGLMALGAARYVARANRGDLQRPAPSQNDVQAAILAIQEYASVTGRSPWNVGYTGRVGSAATQALRLARDAGICADIAATLPDGATAPGFQIWHEAEQRHAFVSMALDRGLVMGMPLDEARRFASSAMQRANALKAAPDALAAMAVAGLPVASVEAVIIAARAIMPDGPPPCSPYGKSVETPDMKGFRYTVW